MSAVLDPIPTIEPMRHDRLDEIDAIERDLYDFPWTIGNFRDSIAAGYRCWEYRCRTALIGYGVVMVAVDEAHLLNLSIARSHQRKGHGTRLLQALCAEARENGARHMLLEVRPSNAAARALYEGLGYERIGIRKGYYPAVGGREDALVYRSAL